MRSSFLLIEVSLISPLRGGLADNAGPPKARQRPAKVC